MGHESRIEPWSPNLTTFCFVGFGTDRLRRQAAMKTAGKENPNRCTITRQPTELLGRKLEASLLNQARWKASKHPAMAKYFFLNFPFIDLTRSWQLIAAQSGFDNYFGVADNAGFTGCAANPAWLMGKQCSTFTRNCRQTSEDRLRRFTSRFVLDHIPVSLGSSSFINIPSDKFRHLQSRSLSGLPQ